MFRSRSNSRGFGCAIVAGGVVILGAFALLWFNEGRTNLGKVATESVLASVEELGTLDVGTFVAAQGKLSGVEPIGDPGLLKPGDYLEIMRNVEMYSWEESSSGDEDSTTYTYAKVWTEDPKDSSSFNSPSEHKNPPKLYDSTTLKVDSAKLGGYDVNIQELALPSSDNLVLTNDNLRAGDDPPDITRELSNNQLFIGRGSLAQPSIGDVRISYRTVADDLQVTLFGATAENAIMPYVHTDESMLYRAFTSSREEAITDMKFEYRAILWGLRIGGTFLNWLGLMIMIGPVTSLLSRIPALGRLGNKLIAIVAFFGALIVSVIWILIAIVAHNPLLLVLVILIGGGVGYWLWRNQQDEEKEAFQN